MRVKNNFFYQTNNFYYIFKSFQHDSWGIKMLMVYLGGS